MRGKSDKTKRLLDRLRGWVSTPSTTLPVGARPSGRFSKDIDNTELGKGVTLGPDFYCATLFNHGVTCLIAQRLGSYNINRGFWVSHHIQALDLTVRMIQNRSHHGEHYQS